MVIALMRDATWLVDSIIHFRTNNSATCVRALFILALRVFFESYSRARDWLTKAFARALWPAASVIRDHNRVSTCVKRQSPYLKQLLVFWLMSHSDLPAEEKGFPRVRQQRSLPVKGRNQTEVHEHTGIIQEPVNICCTRLERKIWEMRCWVSFITGISSEAMEHSMTTAFKL